MLTEAGLKFLIERLEDQAVSAARAEMREADLRSTMDEWRAERTQRGLELVELRSAHHDAAADVQRLEVERDDERRLRVEAEERLARLRSTPQVTFPFLLDRKDHVFVAFANPTFDVSTVKDDDGLYQSAGDQPDYAALIAAPLNPRCFLTCRTLNLVRLPAAPVGRLLVDDDIPF